MFVIEAHASGIVRRVTASVEGRLVVVRTGGEPPSLARSVHEAGRKALELCADVLGRSTTGADWGLLVHAGDANALFGTPAPGTELDLPRGRARQDSPVARIYAVWQGEGETSDGALEAALRIIETYCIGRERRAA